MKKIFNYLALSLITVFAIVAGGQAAGIWNVGEHTIQSVLWKFVGTSKLDMQTGTEIEMDSGSTFDFGGTGDFTGATVSGGTFASPTISGTVTGNVITQANIQDKAWRIPIPVSSVFVDGTGPITSSSAPNVATTDNVAAIVYDNSGETAEIQFPYFPDVNMTALTVNLLCSSSVATGSQQAVDWSIFVHGDDVGFQSAVGQTGATLASTTLDASEELVTLTLDATGLAAITAGTSGVDIAVWNNGTSNGTLEIKQIWLEETR